MGRATCKSWPVKLWVFENILRIYGIYHLGLQGLPPVVMASFLPSLLPSLLASFPPCFLPSLLPSLRASFPPCFLPWAGLQGGIPLGGAVEPRTWIIYTILLSTISTIQIQIASCLSIHWSIYLFVYLSSCQLFTLYLYLCISPIHPPTHWSTHPLIHPSIRPSMHAYIGPWWFAMVCDVLL